MANLSSSMQPSRMRKVHTKKLSPLFTGHNVTAQLQNSSFGLFSAYLEDITQHLLAVSFKLPCVTVVGDKSAGKSSLLEMITKCPIFPRHTDFCTKLPIKLKLKPAASEAESSLSIKIGSQKQQLEVSEIAALVDKIMAETTSISNQEIVVEICKVGMPDFELVDLPGLQTFPEEQYQATTKLVDHYLQQPDTLVLCVVDATTPALDGSIALKMIRDADKLGSTILALTKCDLVASEIGQVENIFDRVLRQSAENEHLEGLAGCVAVANRDCTDRISLREADSAERMVFEAMLADPAKAFAPEEVQQQLQQGMGSKQLIMKLDEMFHNHIVQHWKPSALQQLQGVMDQTEGSIADVGTPVEALCKQDVLHYIQQQVSVDSICTSMRHRMKDSKLQKLAAAFDHQQWWTPGWAQKGSELGQSIAARLHIVAFKQARLYHGLGPVVLGAFSSVCSANSPGYRLQRFTSLRPALEALLVKCMDGVFDAAMPTIDVMADEAVATLYASPNAVICQSADGPPCPATDMVEALFKTVDGCILSYVVPALKHGDLQLPSSFQLVEDTKVQQARVMLNKQLLALADAHHKISFIEQALHDVRSQQTAAAVTAMLPTQSVQADSALISTGDVSRLTSNGWQLESFYSVDSVATSAADEAGQGGPEEQDLQPEAQRSQLHVDAGQTDSVEHTIGKQPADRCVDQEESHVGAVRSLETTLEAEHEEKYTDAVKHRQTVTSTDINTSLLSEGATGAGAENAAAAQVQAHSFDEVPISPISSVADSYVHVEW